MGVNNVGYFYGGRSEVKIFQRDDFRVRRRRWLHRGRGGVVDFVKFSNTKKKKKTIISNKNVDLLRTGFEPATYGQRSFVITAHRSTKRATTKRHGTSGPANGFKASRTRHRRTSTTTWSNRWFCDDRARAVRTSLVLAAALSSGQERRARPAVPLVFVLLRESGESADSVAARRDVKTVIGGTTGGGHGNNLPCE